MMPLFGQVPRITSVKRIGRNRFVRNVLIAAGNSRHVDLTPDVEALIHDPEPYIRGTAIWALHV